MNLGAPYRELVSLGRGTTVSRCFRRSRDRRSPSSSKRAVSPASSSPLPSSLPSPLPSSSPSPSSSSSPLPAQQQQRQLLPQQQQQQQQRRRRLSSCLRSSLSRWSIWSRAAVTGVVAVPQRHRKWRRPSGKRIGLRERASGNGNGIGIGIGIGIEIEISSRFASGRWNGSEIGNSGGGDRNSGNNSDNSNNSYRSVRAKTRARARARSRARSRAKKRAAAGLYDTRSRRCRWRGRKKRRKRWIIECSSSGGGGGGGGGGVGTRIPSAWNAWSRHCYYHYCHCRASWRPVFSPPCKLSSRWRGSSWPFASRITVEIILEIAGIVEKEAVCSRGTSKGPAAPGRSDSCHPAIGSGISTSGADIIYESSRRQHRLDHPRGEERLAEQPTVPLHAQIRSSVYRLYDRHRQLSYDKRFALLRSAITACSSICSSIPRDSRCSLPLRPRRSESRRSTDENRRGDASTEAVDRIVVDLRRIEERGSASRLGVTDDPSSSERTSVERTTSTEARRRTTTTTTTTTTRNGRIERHTRRANKSPDLWWQRCGALCNRTTGTYAIATGIISETNSISRYIVGVDIIETDIVENGKATWTNRRILDRVTSQWRGPSTGTIVVGTDRGR